MFSEVKFCRITMRDTHTSICIDKIISTITLNRILRLIRATTSFFLLVLESANTAKCPIDKHSHIQTYT